MKRREKTVEKTYSINELKNLIDNEMYCYLKRTIKMKNEGASKEVMAEECGMLRGFVSLALDIGIINLNEQINILNLLSRFIDR